MANISKNSSGLSGEYFVAAELYRRGWQVGLTMGSAKSIDMYAEKGKNLIRIQVKSLFKKKNNSFPINKNSILKDVIFIFVVLNAEEMTNPDYYICNYSEVSKIIQTFTNRSVVQLGKLKGISNVVLNNWEKLEKSNAKK